MLVSVFCRPWPVLPLVWALGAAGLAHASSPSHAPVSATAALAPPLESSASAQRRDAQEALPGKPARLQRETITLRTDPPDLLLPDGGRYYGPVENGLMTGQGRIEWNEYRWYTGHLEQGRMHGQGSLHTKDGHVQGEFRHGMPDGHGTEVGSKGQRYVGQFRQGLHDGQGVLTDEDGIRYEGQFQDGSFTGQGRVSSPDGEVMSGQFEDFQPKGVMVLRHPNGLQITSEMKNGMPHGEGELRLPNGVRIRGELGGPMRTGEVVYPNGDRYQGELRQQRPHGQGELRYANGEVYQGPFVRGLPHGAGRLSLAQGGAVQTGQWRAGKRLSEEAAAQGQPPDSAAEPSSAKPEAEDEERQEAALTRLAAQNNQLALYAQTDLLHQQMAALKPNDPNRTELYALFVAGDGTQEVFRREVEWVAESFARRYDTAGRAMVLANSRTSVARLPLATEVSLERSLHALAQRMDPENDLLFVYLSSHGSRDHDLSIDMRDMALPQLSAKRLGDLLKASGIRQQVVVVSACYSGGFVAPLQGPNTWVLTAARADRSSFGCADENDFTYFGRALFKESLPQAASLSAAFEQAKTLVQQWETELRDTTAGADEVPHSEPQMQVSPEFQRVVDGWFAQHAKPRPTRP